LFVVGVLVKLSVYLRIPFKGWTLKLTCVNVGDQFMLNEKSCGAVVYIKNPEVKYLLLQYEAGHWDFVKGNVEEGETEQETALRELREETGIVDACFLNGFKETISYFYKRQGATVYKEVVFFLMNTKTNDIKLSFEHIGFDWLPYDDALRKLTFRNASDVLHKAHV
jgi:8-oxo-dGTP pyrophosphatase MutT (NUDIX family)